MGVINMVYRCVDCKKRLWIGKIYWKNNETKIIEMYCAKHGKVSVDYKYIIDASRCRGTNLFFKCTKLNIRMIISHSFNLMKKFKNCFHWNNYKNFGFEYTKDDFRK